MELTQIINSIISLATLIGLIFAVFFFFKNPQVLLEKKQALNEANDKNKTPITNFEILKTQFDMMCKSNDDKFMRLETQIEKAFVVANNHTNETDSKVTGLVAEVGSLRNEVTKLGTIIEERIPKKV